MNDTNITRVLQEAEHGDTEAGARLLSMVYDELRQMAAQKMAREAPGSTLQATLLVHDAWQKLGGGNFQNRRHFFGAAAEAMRRMLVDHARHKGARRHGGGLQREALSEQIPIQNDRPPEEILGVHDALEKLAAEYPVHADVVKFRYFADFTVEETAEAMGISEPTVKRYWAFARPWLYAEIKAAKERSN